ncbi:MAG: radical SAM protein [Candidatus Omnitrophica bacterium]|nr:radical SAM protein [Candidatus Omnitrophota bacterium]
MINKLNLYLVKPSKYDDDGYVIRHWKGVLPSNTLACLYGLSKDIEARQALGKSLKWCIEVMDETVQKIPIRKMIDRSRQKDTKTIVCLVGVQSNQFPRAADLALEFRRAGLDVLMGGFHVSGTFSTLSEMPREILELQQAGVTMVAGEVEGRLEMILRDALQGTLKPVYNFLSEPVDLSEAPMPQMPVNLLSRYAVANVATLDCGRGCPFTCSFCTVINVHGRRMRLRPVHAIERLIRENYRRHKISRYFFTDDNFCRNRNWEAIFDAVIRLREEEKIPLTFMMQVDALSFKIPRFIEKASRAGCTQVFIGIESLNEKNLATAGKVQNRCDDFKKLIDAYQQARIPTHLAYIIGFPFDTELSVREDVARLQELGAEQASFFMMTPLPGSVDYSQGISGRTMLDADLNNYDTFHETFCHPGLKAHAWTRAYEDAWHSFYGRENVMNILKKVRRENYWKVLLNYFWYKNAIQVEGGHPMLHGFFRQKSRKERRPIYALESPWQFLKRRVGDVRSTLVGWIRLILEIEDVWLATRTRSVLEARVVLELSRQQKRVLDWRNLRARELQVFYRNAAAYLERSYQRRLASSCRIPSRFQLWLEKRNVFSDSLTSTRRSLDLFWKGFNRNLRRGKIDRIHPLKVAYMGLRECVLFSRFFFALANKTY